jgi:hypothetical protein
MQHCVTLLEDALNLKASRVHKVFFRSETYLLQSVYNNPVVRVIQDIYDRAIGSPDFNEHASSDVGI